MPPSELLTLAATSAFPVGATVAVTLPERYVLVGAALVYGLPLGALLGGAAMAAAIFGSDWAAAAGGAAALLLALLAVRPYAGASNGPRCIGSPCGPSREPCER